MNEVGVRKFDIDFRSFTTLFNESEVGEPAVLLSLW